MYSKIYFIKSTKNKILKTKHVYFYLKNYNYS